MRSAGILIFGLMFFLAGCSVIPLPTLPGTYSASTSFVAYAYQGEVDIEVKRGERFLVQNIRYDEKVILSGSYSTEIDDGDKGFQAGTELFVVRYDSGRIFKLSGGNFSTINDPMTKAYCGISQRMSGLVRVMKGARTGDDLRCFQDSDGDGKFDKLHKAVGASQYPVTVFEIHQKSIDIEPLAFEVVKSFDAKPDGEIWLEVRSNLWADPLVSMYIGAQGRKEQLTRDHSIDQSNLPRTLYISGTEITVTKEENKISAIHIDKSISPYSTFSYRKTVTTTTSSMPIFIYR